MSSFIYTENLNLFSTFLAFFAKQLVPLQELTEINISSLSYRNASSFYPPQGPLPPAPPRLRRFGLLKVVFTISLGLAIGASIREEEDTVTDANN